MIFHIGQRVRIAHGPQQDIGVVGTVVGRPRRLGHVDPPSTFYGQDPNWLIYPLDIPGAVIPEGPGMYLGYPGHFLEPILDEDGSGRDAVEWTDELRQLCGVYPRENA